MKKISLLGISLTALITGCTSSAPTKIGADTYYAAKPNSGGIFGDPASVAGELMANGFQLCAAEGKEFELVTKEVTPSGFGRMGGASITFKCVIKAANPVMRRDNGVTTIENR